MKSRDDIEKELSLTIASALESKIRESGEASLLVSGGSTPVNLFKELSKFKINWDKVTISLVDERWVMKGHHDSNEHLVREHLIQNEAKNARFIPLLIDEADQEKNITAVRKLTESMVMPFTVVVLGMGTDGHTASLFPKSPQLEVGMNLETQEKIILTEPQTAPYSRISFTRSALLDTEYLFLHCYGAEKREILKQAKEDKMKYPISGFIHQDKVKLDVFWAN